MDGCFLPLGDSLSPAHEDSVLQPDSKYLNCPRETEYMSSNNSVLYFFYYPLYYILESVQISTNRPNGFNRISSSHDFIACGRIKS